MSVPSSPRPTLAQFLAGSRPLAQFVAPKSEARPRWNGPATLATLGFSAPRFSEIEVKPEQLQLQQQHSDSSEQMHGDGVRAGDQTSTDTELVADSPAPAAITPAAGPAPAAVATAHSPSPATVATTIEGPAQGPAPAPAAAIEPGTADGPAAAAPTASLTARPTHPIRLTTLTNTDVTSGWTFPTRMKQDSRNEYVSRQLRTMTPSGGATLPPLRSRASSRARAASRRASRVRTPRPMTIEEYWAERAQQFYTDLLRRQHTLGARPAAGAAASTPMPSVRQLSLRSVVKAALGEKLSMWDHLALRVSKREGSEANASGEGVDVTAPKLVDMRARFRAYTRVALSTERSEITARNKRARQLEERQKAKEKMVRKEEARRQEEAANKGGLRARFPLTWQEQTSPAWHARTSLAFGGIGYHMDLLADDVEPGVRALGLDPRCGPRCAPQTLPQGESRLACRPLVSIAPLSLPRAPRQIDQPAALRTLRTQLASYHAHLACPAT